MRSDSILVIVTTLVTLLVGSPGHVGKHGDRGKELGPRSQSSDDKIELLAVYIRGFQKK